MTHRANAFMWRVLHNALPVDQNVQRKDIPLVSQCLCSASPKIETLELLLIHSDLPTEVRLFFAAKVKKQAQVHSVRSFLQRWTHGISYRSQFGNTMLGIIFFTIWHIWKHRCNLRFEGGTRDSRAIICETLHHLREANMVSRSKRTPKRMDRILLEMLGVQIYDPVVRRGRWVAWSKPGSNLYKLNTDGSRKRNAATGGGVLRDSEGEFILGFATRFKHSGCNTPETSNLCL